jgi:CRP-like cAMP-binding protein
MNAAYIHQPDPRDNHLLAALSGGDWEPWAPHFERVELPFRHVLSDSGSAPAHMVFPTTAVVSLQYLTLDGGSAEYAVVGNDGAVGLSLFMGGHAALGQAVVHSAGHGYRLRAQAVKSEMFRTGPLMRVLLNYTQTLIAQVAQTAMCNRYHSIEQQLCRRLLVGLDYAESNDLRLTQELMANLLGVRREGVTAAALKLQLAGVIRYSRGLISVLDRRRLALRACECYGVTRRSFGYREPQPLAA